MSNTRIQLKKSGITGNSPSGLEYGELALNYADGKLFYRNTSNSVVYINNQDSFSTISVGNNLILSTSPTDILSIVSGNNVNITSDGTSKTITIGVNPVDTITSNDISLVSSAKSVNTVYSYAQAAYNYANTISGGAAIDNVARSLAETSYNQSNTALVVVGEVYNQSNISIVLSQSAFDTSNTSLVLAQAAFDKANTGVSTSSDQFARDTANSAFDAANTAQSSIPSLSGYATESFVTGQGYLTSSNLSGYATESYVNFQGFVTGTPWRTEGYLTASSGYATESYVNSQGFITGTPWQYYVDVAFDAANASFQQANSGILLAQAAFNKANTGTSSSSDQYARDTANSGIILAQAAFNKANTNTGTGFSGNTIGFDTGGQIYNNVATVGDVTSSVNFDETFGGYLSITPDSGSGVHQFRVSGPTNNITLLENLPVGTALTINTNYFYGGPCTVILTSQFTNNGSSSWLANLNGDVFAGLELNPYEYIVDVTYPETSIPSNQVVDTFSSTQFRTAKYLIQSLNDTDIHSVEVLLSHNDVDVFLTEYATLKSNTDLISISASLQSNTVALTVTPSTTNTIIDFIRTSLTARTFGGTGSSTSSGDLMTLSGLEDLMLGSGLEDLLV